MLKAFTPLRAALRHRHPETRQLAAAALGKDRARGETGALRRDLANDNRHVRISAIRALGTVGGGAARQALLKLVRDKDEGIQRAAMSALTETHQGRAVALLAAAMEHSDPERRLEAATHLAACGGKIPLLWLLKALGDREVQRSEVQRKGAEHRRWWGHYLAGLLVTPQMLLLWSRQFRYMRF
jgi:HEAT repeat protein